jgi:Skp family chaperone for outer membrane proteins
MTRYILMAIMMLLTLCSTKSMKAEESSTTWESMSERFEETLHAHELTLRLLSERLKKSELSGTQLEGSLELLSKLNADLRTSAEQLGERLQERDEDLVRLQNQLDKADKKLHITKFIMIFFMVTTVLFGAFFALMAGRKL